MGRASSLGYECEIYCEDSHIFQVDVHLGRLESISASRDTGMGLRLSRDGKTGYTWTSDLTGEGLSSALEEARINTDAAGELDADVLADDCPIGDRIVREAPYPDETARALKVEGALEMESRALGCDTTVRNTEGAGYFDITSDIYIASTRGFFRRERRGMCCCSLCAVAEAAGEQRSGYYHGQALEPGSIDFTGVGEEAALRAVRLLGGGPLPSGRYPVVFDGAAFADVVSLIGRALSAEMVVKGMSILAGKLEEKLSVNDLGIVDDPFMQGGCYGSSFDDEGVPRRRSVLIDAGVLKGFLHSCHSARLMGLPATGNAIRDSFKDLPVPGPSNLAVMPGTRSTLELVEDLEEGIFIQDIIGMHTADPISGDFSLGINGLHIKGGSIEGAVSEMTISGDITALLGGIREIGSEIVFIGPFGSPAVSVEGLSLSGR
jgi:PmbA protein